MGFIKINRKFFENPLWKEPREYSRAEAWLDLIASARFESSLLILNSRAIEVQNGEIAVSRRFLEQRWRWGGTKVNNFLDLLKANKMIETRQVAGQTIMKLVNYDKYNTSQTTQQTTLQTTSTQLPQADADNLQTTRQTTQQTTRKPPTNHPQTTDEPNIKNRKKENNKEKEANASQKKGELSFSGQKSIPIDFLALVDFFNSKTKGIFGTIISPMSNKRKGLVRARIAEHGKDAFAEVIQKAIESDFLRGQNNREFTATFDWLIKPTNFEKVLSGNYDNHPNNAKNRQPNPTTTTEQRVAEVLRAAAEGCARATTKQPWED